MKRFILSLFLVLALLVPTVVTAAPLVKSDIQSPTITRRVATLAELQAVPVTSSTIKSVYVEGRLSAGDGYEGVFYGLAGDQSANPLVVLDTEQGIYARPTTPGDGSTGVWVRADQKTASPAWFGAIGDGSDETTELLATFASVAEGLIKFGKDKIYLSTESLGLLDGTELDLNGSTLNFAVIGETRCLVLNNWNYIHNGTVANTLNQSGFGGDYQTPVQVGTSRDALNRKNNRIEDLAITTAVNNGNGIAVFGDASGLAIRNIEFPQSATLGRAIMLHWGSLGVLPVVQTYHVNDVTIENIVSRGMTISGETDVAVIFLSAVYNVEVSNVYCFGVEEGDIVRVFAGDYGYQYAQTLTERELGGTGIKVENVFGRGGKGIAVGMLNSSGPTVKVWPSSVEISGFGVKGYGSTDTFSNGVDIQQSTNVTVTSSTFSDFYVGAFIGAGTSDLLFEKTSFINGYLKGFDCRFAAENITIRDSTFKDNNVSVGSGYDIFLAICENVLIDNNTFDSSDALNNIRLDTGANVPVNVKVTNNRSKSVNATGPAFSFGGVGDDKVCTLYNGNTVDVVPSNGIVGGQPHIPYSRFSSRNGSIENVEFTSAAVPTTGTWNPGDTGKKELVTIDGNNMMLVGWECLTGGTPGTWAAKYISSVSPAN